MLLHSFIIAWPCVMLFLLLSRTEGVPLCIISAEHQLVIFLQRRSKAISPSLVEQIFGHGHSTSIPPCVHLRGNFMNRENGSLWAEGVHMGVFRLMTGAAVFYRHSCIMPNSLANMSLSAPNGNFRNFQHWHKPAQRQRQTGVGVVGRGLTVWLHTWVHSGDRVARWLP